MVGKNQHRYNSVTFPLNPGTGTSNAKKVFLKYEREHERGNELVDKMPALCVGMVGRDTSESVTTDVFGIDLVQTDEAIIGVPEIIEAKAYDGYPRDPSDDRRRLNFDESGQTDAQKNTFFRVYNVGVAIFAVVDVLIGAGAFTGVIPGEPVIGALGGPHGSSTTTLGEDAGQPGYVKGLTAFAGTATAANNAAILKELVKTSRNVVIEKFSAADTGTRDGVARVLFG